jgi:hypothetical protein
VSSILRDPLCDCLLIRSSAPTNCDFIFFVCVPFLFLWSYVLASIPSPNHVYFVAQVVRGDFDQRFLALRQAGEGRVALTPGGVRHRHILAVSPRQVSDWLLDHTACHQVVS